MNCRALIISCIDFRFHTKIRQYAEDNGILDNYDLLAVAGSVKDIDKDEFLIKQIEISYNLHKIKEVHILSHQDCGAYGGSSKFSSTEEEYETYKRDQDKAEYIILSKFPDLTVYKNILHV